MEKVCAAFRKFCENFLPVSHVLSSCSLAEKGKMEWPTKLSIKAVLGLPHGQTEGGSQSMEFTICPWLSHEQQSLESGWHSCSLQSHGDIGVIMPVGLKERNTAPKAEKWWRGSGLQNRR